MTEALQVRTGRERSRWVCPSCLERIYVGEPVENSVWPARLKLTPNQVKYLLIAAAEYRDLTAACGKCHHGPHYSENPCPAIECGCTSYEPVGVESAVSFVDWMAVDALRPEPWDKTPDVEGAPRHNINGEVAVMQHKGDTHRHPFPMPVMSSGERHTKGRRAG